MRREHHRYPAARGLAQINAPRTKNDVFAGARLTTADGRSRPTPAPFASSSATTREADAELLPGEVDGELHLTVDTHRAAAGHDIPTTR
jgi:hypothetical protein